MRFGVMNWVIGDGPTDALEAAADAGFEGVELSLAGPDSGDDPAWTSDGRNELRTRAADLDVEIASICLGFLNQGGLTSEDPDVRDRAREGIRRGVDAAAALDVDAVLVPFFGDAEIETDEHRERVVEGVRETTDVAEAAGVTLALENTLPAQENLELLSAIDSPAAGVYYDTGNAIFRDQDPIAGIETLGDKMARLHFKDWTGEDSVMLGEGEVDFDAVREALDEVGYDDWIVLETAVEGDDKRASAEKNLEFARDVFA